jgi:zinc protease
MSKKLPLVVLLILILSLTLAGPLQAQGPGPKTIDFKNYELNLVDYTLSNGLRVILAEDHSAPVVAVDTWYRVGGANDPQNRSGFAHLFEHMMFEGSAHVATGQWDKLLEAIGANHNAYTENDKTAFWDVAPANQLPRVLWMESDRMASLSVTQQAFQTERQVVIQEYNQRVANNPYGLANERLFTQPLQGYPPYERPVIGSVQDLNAATLKEVQDFHSTYYKPNNATLVIVGDIDVKQTQALVQAYYGDIPAGPEVTPILQRYPLPRQFPTLGTDPTTGCHTGTQETLIDPQVEVPRFAATVVAPPRGTSDYYALKLLTDILGSGNSSRFEQDIVRQGLAASAFVGLNDYQGGSILYGAALPNSGDTAAAMQKLVLAEFDKVRKEGVTEAELARVKKQVLVNAITSFRASALNSAEWLQDYTLTFGNPQGIEAELARYDAVTRADIQRVAQTYLCDKPMNFQTVLPQGQQKLSQYPGLLVKPALSSVEGPVAGAKASPQPASPVLTLKPSDPVWAGLPKGVINRTGVPAPLGELTSTFPPFETFKLSNGMEVIFVEQHEVPKLHLELVVGGSNPAAPANKQGVADLMAGLITKGTTTRSAAQIAESIESVGGSLDSNAALEWTSVSVDVLTTDTGLAFDLLNDLARNATFPQKELDVDKTQMLTSLEQDAVDPSSMANRQFGRIAYGNHPYGFITSPETVKNLTREDVVQFYQTYFKPNNALLIIVGDLTPEEARAQTEQAFGGWPSGPISDYLKYPPARLGDTSVIYLVDRPNSEQATIQIGNRAINARNPDRYALAVVNTVLGGSSASRLYTDLREAKGYTYDIYSRFGEPNDTSTFRVISDVSQDHAGDAVQEILKQLKAIRMQPISQKELQDAKGLLTGSFALSLENPADFADQLAARYLTGVPIEELKTYLQSLQQVTPEQAQAAAAKYIDSEHPIIVVVGDAKILKPQLEKIGRVVAVDNQGKPLS